MQLIRQRTLTIIVDTEHPYIKRLERAKGKDTFILEGMRRPEYMSFEDAEIAYSFMYK